MQAIEMKLWNDVPPSNHKKAFSEVASDVFNSKQE